MKDKLQQILGLGVIVVAAAVGLWHFHSAPEPPLAQIAPIALPDLGQVLVEPLEPIKPPAPWREPTLWTHWPSCSARLLVQQQEDAALVAVLASAVEGDELFGGTEMRMEAAECAARRWRLAGR